MPVNLPTTAWATYSRRHLIIAIVFSRPSARAVRCASTFDAPLTRHLFANLILPYISAAHRLVTENGCCAAPNPPLYRGVSPQPAGADSP